MTDSTILEAVALLKQYIVTNGIAQTAKVVLTKEETILEWSKGDAIPNEFMAKRILSALSVPKAPSDQRLNITRGH